MKTLKNNKGAAMVTVLIAVTFILILASSLLYMSYMNYISKALRYSSTDMFYTAEFALDDLSSTMQEIAADSADIATAKTNVSNALGITTNSNGKSVYTYSNVENLIQVASQEASISINCAAQKDIAGVETENTAIVSANSITLKAVQVTATTDEGYTSTITSDIILNFPPGAIGEMDVNDFSVIADAPITVEAGDLVVGGNIYIHSPDPVTTALHVKSLACVELLSNYGIIYGNVVVEGTGVLCITGDVKVTGDIYVRDNAVLICSGELGHGTIHKDPNARVLGITDFSDQNIPTAGLPTAGLADLLFEDVWIRSNGAASFREITLSDFIDGIGWGRYSASSGTPVNIKINQQNVENGVSNSLILADEAVKIRGEYTNSTCVCTSNIIFDITTAPTYMQCMSDATYQNAKDTLVGTNGRSGMQILGENVNFHGGTITDIPASPPAADTYAGNTHSGATINYYCNGNDNYLPFGNFLIDDSSTVITQIFASVGTTQLPKNTTIIYDNWSKE